MRRTEPVLWHNGAARPTDSREPGGTATEGEVVGVRLEDFVLLGAAHALVLALDLLHQVGEGPAGAVLERVTGGVEGVAGLAGAHSGPQVDHDVGLEVAAPRGLAKLEEAFLPYTAAISRGSRRSAGSAPTCEDALGGPDARASSVDQAGEGETRAETCGFGRGKVNTLISSRRWPISDTGRRYERLTGGAGWKCRISSPVSIDAAPPLSPPSS
jgi:hypothetical protein